MDALEPAKMEGQSMLRICSLMWSCRKLVLYISLNLAVLLCCIL